MQRLVATAAILYQSKLYAPGDELPANNSSMVDAWLEAGTAVWTEEESNIAPKARLATAEPGLPGSAINSESENGDNLIGKVPKTSARKKK